MHLIDLLFTDVLKASWYWLTSWTLLKVLQWSAAALTIWGAWLLSEPSYPVSRGFTFFLGANGIWICYAWLTGQDGLLVQQIVLTGISLKGIRKGLVTPAINAPLQQLLEEKQ